MLAPGIGHNGAPHLWVPRPTATVQDILGADLVGFVDFEDDDQITESSGAISAYADLVNGASYAQASGAARPALAANVVTGRQVARFAGAQQLEYTGIPAGIPTGASPGEIIAIVSQTASAAATIASHGAASNNSNRRIARNSSSNVFQVSVGNGSSIIAEGQTADFSGNRFVRGVIDGTTIYADMDGVVSAGTACVPSTGTSRVRIGANTAASAGNYLIGDISCVLWTNAVLTAAKLNALAVCLAPRIFG